MSGSVAPGQLSPSPNLEYAAAAAAVGTIAFPSLRRAAGDRLGDQAYVRGGAVLAAHEQADRLEGGQRRFCSWLTKARGHRGARATPRDESRPLPRQSFASATSPIRLRARGCRFRLRRPQSRSQNRRPLPYLNGGWCQGLRLGELGWGWLRGRPALSGSAGTGCGGRDVMVNRSSRGATAAARSLKLTELAARFRHLEVGRTEIGGVGVRSRVRSRLARVRGEGGSCAGRSCGRWSATRGCG
jgi:hypothetical protein